MRKISFFILILTTSLFLGSCSFWNLTEDLALSFIEELSFNNKRNYAAFDNSWQGVELYDLDKPGAPKHLGSLDFIDQGITTYSQNCYMEFDGDDLYLLKDPDILTIIDLSDPDNITVLSETVLLDPMSTFGPLEKLSGDYLLYLNDSESKVIVMDISSRSAPVKAAETGITLGLYNGASLLLDDYFYITDDSGNLTVIDLTDPATPQVSGVYDFNIWISSGGLKTANDVLYGQTEDRKIMMIDISDPSHPVKEKVWDPDMKKFDFDVQGNLLCLANGSIDKNEPALVFYDISNPLKPSLEKEIVFDEDWLDSPVIGENYVAVGSFYGTYFFGKPDY